MADKWWQKYEKYIGSEMQKRDPITGESPTLTVKNYLRIAWGLIISVFIKINEGEPPIKEPNYRGIIITIGLLIILVALVKF